MIASIKLSEVSGALFDEKKATLYVFMKSGGFIAIDESAMRNTMRIYKCERIQSFLYSYLTDPDSESDPTIEFSNYEEKSSNPSNPPTNEIKKKPVKSEKLFGL
jgi:hypothetical protein